MQHHCRKCGKAVCGKCSSKRTTFPIMGFEFPVRVCDACFDIIKEEEWVQGVFNFCNNCWHHTPVFRELRATLIKCCYCVCSRTPLATFHEGKHNIAHMDMDPSRGLMVTCGSDRIVKVNNSSLIPDNSCMWGDSVKQSLWCKIQTKSIYSPFISLITTVIKLAS